jgi:hypothetical protein
MVTSTGTTIPVVPGGLIAIAALNVPAPSAAGLAVTWNDPGTLPLVGKTVSQFPLLLVLGVAVKEVTLALLLATETVEDCGTALFAGKLKLSEFGEAVRGLAAFPLMVTCTVNCAPSAETMLINPVSVTFGALAAIETVSDTGVVPELGVIVSQLLSENVVAVMPTGLIEDEISRL